MDSKFNIRSLLVTGLILTFLNTAILFTIIGKGVYDNIAGKDKEGKIVLANVEPTVANELTKQFSYQASSSGTQEYYSPALDALIKYDSSKYFLSENDQSVAVLTRGAYDFDTSARIRLSDEEITVEKAQNSINYLYESVELEEESEIEGLKAMRFSYVKSSFVDDSKGLFNSLYIVREIDGKYIYITINYPDKKEQTGFASDCAKILSNIVLSPTNVPQQIKLTMPDIGVEIEYAKDKWRPASITKSSSFLEFLSSENESKPENKYTTTTISIYGYRNYEGSTLEENHRMLTSYESIKNIYDNFKVISDSVESEFLGNRSYYTEYTYESVGELSRTRVHTIFNEDKSLAIRIQLFTSREGLDGNKEIEKILKSFTLLDPVSEDETSLESGSNQYGNVLGSSTVTIDKSALIGRPSVAKIYNRNCVDIRVDASTTFRITPRKKYELCSGGVGTGFFISSDGYLVTNGHVATPNPLDSVVSTLNSSSLPLFWNDFARDLAILFQETEGVDISKLSSTEILYLVLGSFVEIHQQGGITLTPTYDNYIIKDGGFNVDISTYLPTSDGSVTKLKTIDGQVDSSVLLGYNMALGKQEGLKTPDLAVLKIDDSTVVYPSLRLSSEQYITSGMPISVLGFPAAVDISSHISASAINIPTITNGTISAIKPSQGGTFNLVQVDASVSGGNSGGPILNFDGEVVAVTTYGLNASGSADYNFGVSVDEVAKILAENNIVPKEGVVTEFLVSGANNLEKGYYKYAISDFNKVVELYPDAKETVDPLIAISQKKIDDGEDRTPIFNTIAIEKELTKIGIKVNGNTLVVAIIAFIALLISLSFLLVLLVIRKRKGKSTQPPVVGSVGGMEDHHQYATQATTVDQPQQGITPIQSNSQQTISEVEQVQTGVQPHPEPIAPQQTTVEAPLPPTVPPVSNEVSSLPPTHTPTPSPAQEVPTPIQPTQSVQPPQPSQPVA